MADSSSSQIPPAAPPLQAGESYDELRNLLAQKPYIASDAYLTRVREAMFVTIRGLEQITDMDERMEKLKALAGSWGGETYVALGFSFEYGFNLYFGGQNYMGPNCTFLDVAPIRIGVRTMIGANCSLYTPDHPLSPEARNGIKGPEWARPITIGDDCWLGGSVTIVPGVTIGDGTTIGAGSVVTKNIPARCVAVGNPARVIKTIDKDGKLQPVAKA